MSIVRYSHKIGYILFPYKVKILLKIGILCKISYFLSGSEYFLFVCFFFNYWSYILYFDKNRERDCNDLTKKNCCVDVDNSHINLRSVHNAKARCWRAFPLHRKDFPLHNFTQMFKV